MITQKKLISYKNLSKILFAFFLFLCVPKVTFANIPDIEGYVRVRGSNTPVVGVWVRLTNSAQGDSSCTSGAVNQSRYARTDSSGKYTFISWTNDSRAVGEGVSIDTDLNGSNDAVQYPTFDSCDPSGTPGSIFSCGRDPFVVEVVRPAGWSGSFDSYGNHDENACIFCINNGSFTATVPDLFYNGGGSGGGNTPTIIPSTSPTRAFSPTPTVVPTGSVRLNPIGPISVGGASTLVVPIATSNVATVTFTIGNTAIVSVCSSSSTCSSGSGSYTDTPGFSANMNGFAPGTTTLTVTCTLSGGGTCTGDSETVTVVNPSPWWQVEDSDVISNGNVSSQIPVSCVNPSCTNSLITNNTNESPGVAIAGGNINTSPGKVSTPNDWNASSPYSGNPYSYDYFENKAKCGVTSNLATSTVTNLSNLLLGSPSAGGYYWLRHNGSMQINNDIAIGDNKVILFVKGGDLTINGDITVTSGRGFFMTIVEQNILIDPSVLMLQGLYFSDRQIRTGTNGPGADEQLQVRGSVAAFDRIVLQRNLPNNAAAPGELFEYAADQIMMFPACLGEQEIQWKELAP